MQRFLSGPASKLRLDLEREGIGKSHFLQPVEAACGAGVTGFEVGAKGDQFAVGAHPAQPRDPFRRLPIQNRGSVKPASARIAG